MLDRLKWSIKNISRIPIKVPQTSQYW